MLCRHALVSVVLPLLAAIVCFAPYAWAGQVTVPVDIGVGPAFYHGSGPLFAGTTGAALPGHLGLKVSLAAVIKREVIRANLNRVPKRFRRMASRMREVRYVPSIFLPDALFLSPKLSGTGIYGVTWRPISLSLPLYSRGTTVALGIGALLSAAYIHSDVMAVDSMFFLRPGVDVGARVEVPITQRFLVSFGWNWQLYVPQIVGASLIETTFDQQNLGNAIWNMGQAFVKLHFRFPRTVNL